jgi:hypothetical protein
MYRSLITITLFLGYSLTMAANSVNDLKMAEKSIGIYGLDTEMTSVETNVSSKTGCSISFQTVTPTNPTGCASNDDGMICVTITGTTNEFELSIDNGANWTYGKTTVCKEDIVSGSYTVKIRDQNLCQVTYSGNPVVLSVDDPLTISDIETTSQTYSNLGTVTVTASGTGTKQYRINSGTWQTSNTFTGLTAGTYSINVKDATACIVSDEAIVADERCPVFTSTNTAEKNCFSPIGSITITTTTGIRPLTYSKDNGSNWQSDSIFLNLSSGIYHLAVRANNGCITYGTTAVATGFVQFSGSSSVQNITGCMGDATGEINSSSYGGQTPKHFTIDNGTNWQSSGAFTGLTAGIYTAIVMDYFGCTDTSIFTITQPIHDTINYIMVNSIEGCAGDTTGIIAIDAPLLSPPLLKSGKATSSIFYTIDGGSNWQTSNYFYNLVAGEYTAVVKVDGCEYPYYLNPVIVEEPEPVQFADIDITGDDGSSSGIITITATGGYNNFVYSFNGGSLFGESNILSGISFGSYDLVIQDHEGCTADSTVSVPDQSIVISNAESTNITGCHGDKTGTITITATGGLGSLLYSIDGEISWQSSNLFTGLSADNYYVSVKDEIETTKSWDSNPITITEPTALNFAITKTNPVCSGTSSGQIRFRNVSGGTGTISYSVDGGNNYSSSNTITGLTAGSYTIQIRDENGCIKTYSGNPATLTDPSAFEIGLVNTVDNTLCGDSGNGSIEIRYARRESPPLKSATGTTSHYYYSIDDGTTWQEDSTTFRNLKEGNYYAWARNPDGCLAEWESNPVEISNINSLSIDSIQVTGDDGRTNGQIEIFVSGGIPPYTYRLDEGDWQSSSLYTLLGANSYYVQAKDSEGCVQSQGVAVDSIVYIPDTNFKACLIGNAYINSNGDNEIQVSEAREFDGPIDVSGMGISDLTGIESFKKTINIRCNENLLTSIDLSQNTSIGELQCYSNQISNLDLSKNTLLEELYCNDNLLTGLNVEKNTKLSIITCDENSISELDVSKNSNLDFLSCSDNSLTELDLAHNNKLTQLICTNNSLTSLDLRNGNYVNITTLKCKNNPGLTCVSVDDVSFSETNWVSNFDPGVTFSLDCNPIPDDEVITNTNFESGDTTCYGAYQTITVGGDGNPVDFSVGSSTNLIAGTSITFLPGVHIEQGSYLSATITTDSTFCDGYSGSMAVAVVETKKSKDETDNQKDEGEIMKMQSLKVFPNPNNGKFNVELTGLVNSTEFVIYNFLGSIIYKGKLEAEKTAVDLSEIQNGLYFLKVISNPKPLIQEILIN